MTTPFYFYWCDADMAFSASAYVVDEDIFSFELTHEEGQIPRLEVTIRQDRNEAGIAKGFLNPSAKQWAWLSYNDGVTVTPLFYGRLVAIPSDLNGDLITLQFISRANDWISRRQALADSLKVRPYYDPIFLDDKSRSDPGAIIEGYSAAYHVDRLTLAWTISDILQGEDGTLAFGPTKILADTLQIRIGDTPKSAIRVDANVNWSTQYGGFGEHLIGQWAVDTYTGGSLIQSWPKPGADLGGGWVAGELTSAVDVWNVGNAGTYTESDSWSDTNHEHEEGDAISASYSVTMPVLKNGITTSVKTESDSAAVGGSKDNIYGQSYNTDDTSASASSTWTFIPKWRVLTTLSIRAGGGDTPFAEQSSVTVSAELQPVFDDADTQKEFEVLELNAVDVGEPLIDYAAWSTVAGQAVSLGQVILPNIPVGPGGLSFQICTTAGTCGSSAPLFSDAVGTDTVTGTATFTCIGSSLPAVGSWQAATYVLKGSIIAANGFFLLCISEGMTGLITPAFAYVGNTLDGGVIWASLGAGGPSILIPIGGAPGNTTANAFFGTDRGAWAIEYMIARARAKILTAARAVEITAEIPFEDGLTLSCRKNATLTARDIPGGVATGKIITYSLSADGEGRMTCSLTIGCAVGEGGSVSADPGTPLYAEDGYVAAGYQQVAGQVAVVATDSAYTPPAPPVTISASPNPADYVLAAYWTSNLQAQQNAINARFAFTDRLEAYEFLDAYNRTRERADQLADRLLGAKADLSLPQNSVYFTLSLLPIAGQQGAQPYNVGAATVIVPKQIDLAAE